MPMSVSTTSSNNSNNSNKSFLDKIGLRKQNSSSIDLCDKNPKEAIIKVLKTIKQLNNVQTKDMNIMTFLEMLQMQFYKNVSLALLKDFMTCHKMMPKPIYFHYYIYFLHYAEYYHFTRGVTDVIDTSKKEFHLNSLANIRTQIKYIYRIINKQHFKEINLRNGKQ
jgi:hypothetical protein